MRRSLHKLSSCARGLTGALLLLAPAVRAEEVTPGARAAAVDLFDAADRLKAEGRIADACAKYQESYRFDAQLGALLHLADCLEQAGRLASSYAAFRSAAELALIKNDDRKGLAEERALKLQHRLSRLTVHVPEASRVAGLEVERDGIPLSSASWGTALPADEGEHTLTARAPGYQSWQGKVLVAGDAALASVELPALVPVPSLAKQGVDGGESPAQGSSLRTLGFVAGGAGIVGLGLGALFMVQRGSRLDERDGICPSGVCEPGQVAQAQGRIDDLSGEARTSQTLAVVSFVAGGALIATGSVLLLAAPTREARTAASRLQVAVAATPDLQGVWFRGSF